MFVKSTLTTLAILGLVSLTLPVSSAVRSTSSDPTIVTLTQTGCQFLEPENDVDHGFSPTSMTDCEFINARTADARLQSAEVLELKSGRYIFRVTNKDVPYELGFWLRGKGFSRITLPSVSGGGLKPGSTAEYVVDLREGEYVYSCPLNPTPNYRLVVSS